MSREVSDKSGHAHVLYKTTIKILKNRGSYKEHTQSCAEFHIGHSDRAAEHKNILSVKDMCYGMLFAC